MFQFSNLSKYRSSLMGLGILGVMLAHCLSWTKLSQIIPITIFRPFTGLVFTEGFLLLSGLGLFYSWQKNANTLSFYKKRVNRLLIPYILLSMPFILFSAIASHETPLEAFLRILTLKFWVFGNDSMWYISVSLLLYLIFPFVYKFVFKNNSPTTKIAFLISLWILFCFAIYSYYPVYYKSVELGLPKIWMFFIGMLLGKFAFFDTKVSKKHLAVYTIIVALAIYSNVSSNEFIKPFGDCLLRLVTIPVICLIFNVTAQWNTIIHKILGWFGKYSLELYILHLLVYETIKNSAQYFNTIPFTNYSRIGAFISIFVAISLCSFLHNRIENFLKR